MSSSTSNKFVQWFTKHVRPVFIKTEPPAVVEELDKLAAQVEAQTQPRENYFPICLLGQAGVGKSTLINTLISDKDIVVPSGGGTGPLTANKLRVVYGDNRAFRVHYHKAAELNKTRFILEAELGRRNKIIKTESDEVIQNDFGRDLDELPNLELDDEAQKRTRIEDAIGRASLLIAGSQKASRELSYLVDALRWVLKQELKHQTQFQEEDLVRLNHVQEALQQSASGVFAEYSSEAHPDFMKRLREHASGYMAPLIQEMLIHWPSPVLEDGLELVDLPGIGILSDAYASVTSDYLRNRAKAVMLVADGRGLRREDAELLRNSGFLNRLLHASNDLSADPVALMVVIVKIDDIAVENWRNDKAVNGTAQETKVQHFAKVVDACRSEVTKTLRTYLKEVWQGESGDMTAGKTAVLEALLANLQIFPVSAPQYRLHCSSDEDEDKPFLSRDATNIEQLRTSVAEVARRCLEEQNKRREEVQDRFFGQVRARLNVLSAQRNVEKQAEEAITKFRAELEEYMKPLQREFDTRRGGFRNFLRKTVPTQIESRVENAAVTARKEIEGYLATLKGAHWKTLQAAVRKEGTFYGSKHINLPQDFALRFEEPVAEVWSREILVDLRRETKEFAEYQSAAVTQILDWAKSHGIKVSTRLLEALVEAVKQHRQQVNAVGKEAVNELRDKVREELIKRIEGPIRSKCKRFVADQKDAGAGVKFRILELFSQLAEGVVEAAADPAVVLLVDRFKEVDKEILAAFGEHSEPLSEAAEALLQKQEKVAIKLDKDALELVNSIETALKLIPDNESVAA